MEVGVHTLSGVFHAACGSFRVGMEGPRGLRRREPFRYAQLSRTFGFEGIDSFRASLFASGSFKRFNGGR